MSKILPQPPTWRVIAAFLIVPGLASVLLAMAIPLYAGLSDPIDRVLQTTWAYAAFGAYPPTLILGLPAFLILRKRLRPTALNCAFVGAAVAAVPWLFLGLVSRPDYASVDGRVTYQNGGMTFWGWLELLRLVGMIGLIGAIAGFLFWLIAAAGSTDRTAA